MSEGFLSRWARLKRSNEAAESQAGATAGETGPGAEPEVGPRALAGDDGAFAGPWSGVDPSHAPPDPTNLAVELPAPQSGQASEAAPRLQAISTLNPASDFRPFMQAGVPAEARNAALKKLFADPAFNVMDGLDTYIDDYSLADPIPAEMLKGLMESHLKDAVREALSTPLPPNESGLMSGLSSDESGPDSAQPAGPRIANAPATRQPLFQAEALQTDAAPGAGRTDNPAPAQGELPGSIK